MKTLKQKLSSRKLWAAGAGFASGVVLLTQGETTAGVALMISSVLGYLAAEGYVDAKAAQVVVDFIDDIAEGIEIESGEDE